MRIIQGSKPAGPKPPSGTSPPDAERPATADDATFLRPELRITITGDGIAVVHQPPRP